MGRRGPKPKSPTLKILEGNPGRRGDTTPQAKAGVPRVPSRYGKPERKLWRDLGKRLADNGILTMLDTFALELLVDTQLEYEQMLQNRDTTPFGEQEKIVQRLRVMLREFGLTPASRSAVKVADPKEKKAEADPAARYFA